LIEFVSKKSYVVIANQHVPSLGLTGKLCVIVYHRVIHLSRSSFVIDTGVYWK